MSTRASSRLFLAHHSLENGLGNPLSYGILVVLITVIKSYYTRNGMNLQALRSGLLNVLQISKHFQYVLSGLRFQLRISYLLEYRRCQLYKSCA